MARCINCNRQAQRDKSYCYWCDPQIPEEEKKSARARGGWKTSKLNLPGELLEERGLIPIDSSEKLITFFSLLIEHGWKNVRTMGDLGTLANVGERLGKALGLQLYQQLAERMDSLEADGRAAALEEATKPKEDTEWKVLEDSSND